MTRKAIQRSRGITRLAAARRPVDDPEPRWAGLPLEDPEPMAEDQDLEVLRSVVSAPVATADEETGEHSDDEVQGGTASAHRTGRPHRESGFLTPTRYASSRGRVW